MDLSRRPLCCAAAWLYVGWMLAAGVGCDRFPRDPEGTLDRIQGGVMRVGVAEHPPWVVRDNRDDSPRGVEPESIRDLAKELDSHIEWVWTGESEALDALVRYELDLVLGGLTADSPWKSHVALTRPYHTASIIVAVHPSSTAVTTVEATRIAVRRASRSETLVKDHGGEPVPLATLLAADAQEGLPIATEAWEARALGYVATGIKLGETSYVMAAPPGENAWLLHLERFLRRNRPQPGDTDRGDPP